MTDDEPLKRAMKKYDVYGIGAALVDTELKVQDEFLDSVGIRKGWMVEIDDARRLELLALLKAGADTSQHFCGGSAANTVISVSHFGGRTFFSCRTADDDDGDFFRQGLHGAGVMHNGTCESGGTTGKCLVLLTPDAERTMNSYLGVNKNFSADDLGGEALAASHWLYMEGYLGVHDRNTKAALRAREIARQHDVKLALSFSDPGMVQNHRDNLQKILGDGVDLLFCNEQEALHWAGVRTLSAALPAMRKTARQVLVTRGAEGSLLLEGGQTLQIDPVRVQAVDTTGAGDTFAGAWLFGVVRALPVEQTAQLASLAAAQVVSRYGPRLNRHHCLEILRQAGV